MIGTADTSTIPVPTTDLSLTAMRSGDDVWVSLRHACEAMGIDPENQRRKLRTKPWARAVMSTATGSDGKQYQMTMIDRRTFTMWLATLDASRAAEAARPIIEAFQNEAADALDAYFSEGVAVNPRMAPPPTAPALDAARSQMDLLQAAKGLVDPSYLEGKARIVLARAMGEAPELDAGTTPIYVQDYLTEQGIARGDMRSVSIGFGQALARRYREETGQGPEKFHQNMPDGTTRTVSAYFERDRPFIDTIWGEYLAAKRKAGAAWALAITPEIVQ